MCSRSRESAGSRMEPEQVGFRPQLDDEQYALIADLFLEPPPDPRGGRPRADPRLCLECILWVLIYDRADNSDSPRQRLASRGIELICPHRRRRVKPPTQDGRPLRRYRRRWIIERTIA